MGRIQRSFEKQDCGFSHQLGLPRLASWKVIWFTRPVLRHLGLMRSHDSCMWFYLLGFKAQTGVPQQWPNTQTQRSVICWDSAFLKLVPWPKTLKKKKKSWFTLHACSITSDSLPPHRLARQGSSVCGILQTRILEWVAISSSKGPSWLRHPTCLSCVSCITGRFFTTEPPGRSTLG